MLPTVAYDAIWALAHALDNVTKSGGTLGENAETIEALRHVRFDGASGEVRFDPNLDRRGKYDIMQFRGGSAYDIGTWGGPGQVTVFPGGDAAIPELRRLCDAYQSTGGGLRPWVDAALPVHPPAAVEAYHDSLREKLASYPRHKYNVRDAPEAVKASMESTIVEAIATARQRGKEERVLFEVPTTTEMLIQTGSAPSRVETFESPKLSGSGSAP